MEYVRFLRTSFLLLVVIAFPVANAIPAEDIDKLCNETPEVAFCLNIIGQDPRIPAARDLGDVLLIAITQSKMQVDDATTHIDKVSREFSDPNGTRRIQTCKVNYGIASDRFHTAWELGLQKSFWDVDFLASIGTNAVIDCENVWRRDGPI